MQLTVQRLLLVAAVLGVLAGLSRTPEAQADTPPSPDFFWPYGKALVSGTNLSPAVQTVIGLANGRACGVDQTLIAQAGTGTPADDVGKTVYVVNILADGTAAGQKIGCGKPGDPVIMYFPESHRVGSPQTVFQQGGLRVDLDLSTELSFRLNFPLASGDGVY